MSEHLLLAQGFLDPTRVRVSGIPHPTGTLAPPGPLEKMCTVWLRLPDSGLSLPLFVSTEEFLRSSSMSPAPL